MKRRSINEKPKKSKGLALLIVLIILLGFIASVVLLGEGAISEIIHP
jgi:flagellar basal body-associated protein FliL